MQATAGSDGRVLFYDSAGFCSAGASGIVCPAAAQLVAAPGPAIRTLHWEPGALRGICHLTQFPFLSLALAAARAAKCELHQEPGAANVEAPDIILLYHIT